MAVLIAPRNVVYHRAMKFCHVGVTRGFLEIWGKKGVGGREQTSWEIRAPWPPYFAYSDLNEYGVSHTISGWDIHMHCMYQSSGLHSHSRPVHGQPDTVQCTQTILLKAKRLESGNWSQQFSHNFCKSQRISHEFSGECFHANFDNGDIMGYQTLDPCLRFICDSGM